MNEVPRPDMDKALRAALARAPAVALLGPRQVGKTSLARRLADAVKGAVYLDLESEADLRKLGDARPFLMAQAGRLTIIDEVHRLPTLFQELRGVIDERRRQGERVGQFLLLGSASLDLVQHSSETLAGRIAYVDMPPINIEEAKGAGINADTVFLRGGFPDSLIAASDEASYRWRRDFVRSYLERDVPMFAPRLPSTTIGRLWTMLANAQGTMFNTARLAQSLGVTPPTVTRYVDLLVDLMLVRRLQPWSGTLGKRLVKSPKVYVRDSGLTHALLEIGTLNQLLGHPVVGPSWEGFVIETLIGAVSEAETPFYFRTADGAELDLVFEHGGRPYVGIEIKRSSAPKISSGFTIACDDLEIEHRLIVANVDSDYPARGNIRVHSLASALTALRTLMQPTFE